jgi:hypothetical protein
MTCGAQVLQAVCRDWTALRYPTALVDELLFADMLARATTPIAGA